MPRPRRPGAPEPKRRSRNGCWPCKARKVKCDEEKPSCLNCQRQGESCDYSVRLNWGGRSKRASIDSSAPILKGSRGTPVDFHAVVRLNDVESRNCSAPAVAEKRAFKEAFINFKPGDFGSSEDASPNSNATFGAFDSPRPQTSSDIALSPSQGGNAFASALQRHSPGTPASVRPVNPHTLSQEIGGTASSPADQAVDFPSLSAFVFHSNSISQPLSFLRDVSDPPRHLAVSSGTDQDNQQQYAGRTGSHEERGLSFLLNDIDEPVGPFRELTDCRETPISAAAGSPSMANRGFDCGSTSSLARPSPFSTISIDDGGDTSNSRESVAAQNKWHAYLTSVTDNYGFDSGRPDRDLTLNNDHAAIDINSAVDKASPASQAPQCSGFPVARKPNYSEYYTSPVPINIPRCLSPLPPSLLRNPINLLYFHHFLDHTSKMLVPHDCDKNPFLSVLPSMAISDSNLLNLVLAYSASHRARYLGHPEPANRIAHWVRDVFPTLRMALDASKQDITDSHLATAILLLSLKIVSPTTFEVPITWQSHLKLARDLFMACSDRLARPGNQVGAFFARWLGYIDTMGALSCRQAGPPLMLYHHVLAESSRPKSHDENCVDCFTGFSPRTGLFFIRLAQLVQQCDNERFDDFGHFRRDWHPSADIVMEADALLGDFDDLGEVVHSDPTHHVGIQADDMMSTEEAFRCAGLLHLHRRVLESSPKSFPVQDALRRLLGALDRMRLGASTEVCSLLPLFTAGCESQDPSQRMRVLDRLFELEKSGLKQIQNARRLMQQCWEEDLPWIALADGQFLG